MKNFIESSQLHQDEPPNSEELAAERERERDDGVEEEKSRSRGGGCRTDGRKEEIGRLVGRGRQTRSTR